MGREFRTPAVVTGTRKTGESNAEITLFSPDSGVLRATVYAGRSSSKAIRPPLFSIGEFFLQKTASGHYTLTDARLVEACPFEFTLGQIAAASFITELANLTGESDSRGCFVLLSSALLALAGDDSANNCDRVMIQFVWQLMKNAGFVSPLDCCPVCSRTYTADELLFFSTNLNSFCCENCAEDKGIFIGPGARKYFLITSSMDFDTALTVPLNDATARRLRTVMVRISVHLTAGRLKTVRSGMLDS
ncbi:MAG: DNA repair protein RecO [Spirochaetales bacterium]|nr:DNA repair protein RecO [Spirochaetales bacterium]